MTVKENGACYGVNLNGYPNLPRLLPISETQAGALQVRQFTGHDAFLKSELTNLSPGLGPYI